MQGTVSNGVQRYCQFHSNHYWCSMTIIDTKLLLCSQVITVLRRAVLSPNSLKMHQSLIKASFLPYLCRGTHRLIVEFVQALTLQCLLPAFFFLGILCYALCTFEITHSPAIEHAILGVSENIEYTFTSIKMSKLFLFCPFGQLIKLCIRVICNTGPNSNFFKPEKPEINKKYNYFVSLSFSPLGPPFLR